MVQVSSFCIFVSATGCGESQSPSSAVVAGSGFPSVTQCEPNAEARAGDHLSFTERIVETHNEDTGTGVAAAIGRVNDDELPDLMVAYSWSNGDVTAPTTVRALLGTSSELLAEPTAPIDMGDLNAVELLDTNGDGRHDLVNGPMVALANSDAEFDEAQSVYDEHGVILWGNLNGDDFPDLLRATLDEFVIRYGTGTTLGRPLKIPHNIPRFGNLLRVDLADVNSDGYDDLVSLSHRLTVADEPPPDATFTTYENFGAGFLPGEQSFFRGGPREFHGSGGL